jgi:GAF domain-containing protein
MGLIREFNLSAKAVLGYEKGDEITSYVSHASKLFARKGELWKISRHLLTEGTDGRLVNHFTDLISKSGELIPIRLSASLLENGVVGFFQDQRQIESANQYIQQIHGLLETGKAIAEAADLNAALLATVKKAREQLKADPVCLYYYDQEIDQILLPPIRENLLDKNAVSENEGEDWIVRRVMSEGEIFTEDTPNHLVLGGEFVGREKIRATAACRLLHSKENKIVGVLFCNYRDDHTFTEQEKAFIKLFATDAANAIDNAHSLQQTSRKAKQFYALSRAVKGLAANLTFEASLQSVLERARDMTDAELGALGVMNDEGKFDPFLSSGLDLNTKKLIGDPPSDHGLFGQLFHSPREIMLEDVSDQGNPSDRPTHHPAITSFLGVPITFKDTRIGNLYVTNKKNAAAFDEEDAIGLKLLAALAALCIKSSESTDDKDAENFDIAYLLFSRFASNLRETGIQISNELSKLRRGLLGTIYEESLKKISHVLSDLNSPGYQVELEDRLLSFSMLMNRLLKRLNLDGSAVRLVQNIEPVRFISGNQLFLELALSIVLENGVAAIGRTRRAGMLKIDCFARGGVINTLIADTGDGIPPEIQNDLFKRPVKRRDHSGNASAAAARIIRAYQGEIKIDRSVANEGNNISITLPEAKK